MRNILILKSSIMGQASRTNHLLEHFIQCWQTYYSADHIRTRDLALDPLPVLTSEMMTAFQAVGQSTSLTSLQQQYITLSDQLINELKSSEIIVIGAPMYNYSIPTQLKNYFDLIARAGITFRYTEQGPEGLLKHKKAIIISSRGGLHANTEHDVMTPHLRTFLNFIGIQDIQFIYEEGVGYGPEFAEKACTQAKQIIDQLIKSND